MMQEAVKSSGVIAAGTTTVLTGRGRIHSIGAAGGSANTTVTVYDAVSATGTAVAAVNCVIASNGLYCPINPIEVGTGITVVVAGTGGQGWVTYSLG